MADNKTGFPVITVRERDLREVFECYGLEYKPLTDEQKQALAEKMDYWVHQTSAGDFFRPLLADAMSALNIVSGEDECYDG